MSYRAAGSGNVSFPDICWTISYISPTPEEDGHVLSVSGQFVTDPEVIFLSKVTARGDDIKFADIYGKEGLPLSLGVSAFMECHDKLREYLQTLSQAV